MLAVLHNAKSFFFLLFWAWDIFGSILEVFGTFKKELCSRLGTCDGSSSSSRRCALQSSTLHASCTIVYGKSFLTTHPWPLVCMMLHTMVWPLCQAVPRRQTALWSSFMRRSVGCGLLPRRGVGEDYGRGASDAAVYSSGSAGVYIFMTRNYADVQRNLLLSLQKQPFTRHIDPVLSVTSIKQSNAPGSAIVSRRTSVRDSLLSPR